MGGNGSCTEIHFDRMVPTVAMILWDAFSLPKHGLSLCSIMEIRVVSSEEFHLVRLCLLHQLLLSSLLLQFAIQLQVAFKLWSTFGSNSGESSSIFDFWRSIQPYCSELMCSIR